MSRSGDLPNTDVLPNIILGLTPKTDVSNIHVSELAFPRGPVIKRGIWRTMGESGASSLLEIQSEMLW
jgi:hypothetical protein